MYQRPSAGQVAAKAPPLLQDVELPALAVDDGDRAGWAECMNAVAEPARNRIDPAKLMLTECVRRQFRNAVQHQRTSVCHGTVLCRSDQVRSGTKDWACRAGSGAAASCGVPRKRPPLAIEVRRTEHVQPFIRAIIVKRAEQIPVISVLQDCGVHRLPTLQPDFGRRRPVHRLSPHRGLCGLPTFNRQPAHAVLVLEWHRVGHVVGTAKQWLKTDILETVSGCNVGGPYLAARLPVIEEFGKQRHPAARLNLAGRISEHQVGGEVRQPFNRLRDAARDDVLGRLSNDADIPDFVGYGSFHAIQDTWNGL